MHKYCFHKEVKRGSFLLLLFLVGAASCVHVEEPEFREVKDFKVGNLSLSDVQIGFGMTYYNPNNFSVSVKETGVNVYLDSVFLGTFIQEAAVDVREKADFTIPLSGQIPVGTVLQFNLKDVHNRTILVQAEGTTKVGKGGIYITKKVTYKGRHRRSDLQY